MNKWAVANKSNISSSRHVRINSDDGEICIVTWQGSEKETDRLAQLIAAAPDLLEALREIAAAEREACAELCLETEPFYGQMFAEAIRARGNK